MVSQVTSATAEMAADTWEVTVVMWGWGRTRHLEGVRGRAAHLPPLDAAVALLSSGGFCGGSGGDGGA